MLPSTRSAAKTHSIPRDWFRLRSMNSIRSAPARPFRRSTPFLRRSTSDRIRFIIGQPRLWPVGLPALRMGRTRRVPTDVNKRSATAPIDIAETSANRAFGAQPGSCPEPDHPQSSRTRRVDLGARLAPFPRNDYHILTIKTTMVILGWIFLLRRICGRSKHRRHPGHP